MKPTMLSAQTPLSPTPAGMAIRTVGLTKSYGTAATPVHALRGIDLEIRRGERLGLLGKSGSGKSTLLNVLGGLDRPTSGLVEVAGRDLARLSADHLARHRLTTVGMIFQSFNLIPSRTVLQNVELPLVFAGRRPSERRAAAQSALEMVGLSQRLDHRPGELSGGEHQRAAIARALVNHPEILLADEPTGNLDSSTADEIVELLLHHLDTHDSTLVLVTHDEELARRCTRRIVRLKDGRLLA
jgi:predicted ABC-type transport system involved in lysophospholipase L1 biosynthesis ATPase subunit